jgi:hypothetical protein
MHRRSSFDPRQLRGKSQAPVIKSRKTKCEAPPVITVEFNRAIHRPPCRIIQLRHVWDRRPLILRQIAIEQPNKSSLLTNTYVVRHKVSRVNIGQAHTIDLELIQNLNMTCCSGTKKYFFLKKKIKYYCNLEPSHMERQACKTSLGHKAITLNKMNRVDRPLLSIRRAHPLFKTCKPIIH